ncbi:hypothetical protein [Micromonospora sp. NPDC048063]|uniref:hypothetical protein n=1 Tax=Micromonospora sp. NPDC048063 TaxID=3364256 RepID=UPI003712E351
MTCDNTAELLRVKLRPGNARANTAANHLDVLTQAVAQVPAPHRRHLLIRGDSAAATRAVLDRLTGRNTTAHCGVLAGLVDRRGRTRRHHRPARRGVVAGDRHRRWCA